LRLFRLPAHTNPIPHKHSEASRAPTQTILPAFSSGAALRSATAAKRSASTSNEFIRRHTAPLAGQIGFVSNPLCDLQHHQRTADFSSSAPHVCLRAGNVRVASTRRQLDRHCSTAPVFGYHGVMRAIAGILHQIADNWRPWKQAGNNRSPPGPAMLTLNSVAEALRGRMVLGS
jgi:hypothetical protein